MNSNESKVSQARPESISMRTTIPAFIAKQMGIEINQTLVWELDKDGAGWIATIRRK